MKREKNEFRERTELRVRDKFYYSKRFSMYQHPLDIHEARIFSLLCMQMHRSHKPGVYYRIPWACFVVVGGSKMDTENKIIPFLKGLRKKTLIAEHGGEKILFGYISSARIEVGRHVDIAVDSEMRKIICDWKGDADFSNVRFECLFSWSSEYAWRLYFVLAERAYENSPVLNLTLERLKFFLNIPQDSETYSKYYNLRTIVLEKVQKAFKKDSNFTFTFETIPRKAGRGVKVTGVSFTVRPKGNYKGFITEEIKKIIIEARETEETEIKVIENRNTIEIDLETQKNRQFKKLVEGRWYQGGILGNACTFSGLGKEHNFPLHELDKKIAEGVVKEIIQ